MVARNRRSEDSNEDPTRFQKANNWLRYNVHLIILALPLVFGAATTFGLQWKGSPQSIIAHVDHADSVIINMINNQHTKDRLIDSMLAENIRGLSDTVSIVWAKQLILLSVMCQQLTREQKELISYAIKCSYIPNTTFKKP
jgi:hypothetical protein